MSAAQPVLFGGISVYLQQHRDLPPHPVAARSVVGCAGGDQAIRERLDPGRSADAGRSRRCAVSGYQRKEVAKLVHYLAGEPRPDVVNLPNSMLIALAAPIRRALDRPIVVTLQGDLSRRPGRAA